MASGARSRTTPALPAWSPCLWVRITCPTAAQPSDSDPSAASIASALFSTPVSTSAASPPHAADADADADADGEDASPGVDDAPPGDADAGADADADADAPGVADPG